MSLPRIPVHLRFWDKVNKTPTCWLWTGATAKGYGRIGLRAGKLAQAHVVAWQMVNGDIPDGLFVCHKCDVRNCVNPDHLFLGTHTDNMADMKTKGRHVKAPQIGEKNGTAKLNEQVVRFIRNNYVRYSRELGGPALGAMFGVTSAQINTIIKNKQWRHL